MNQFILVSPQKNGNSQFQVLRNGSSSNTAAPLVHEVQEASTVSHSCVRVQIPELPSKVKNMQPAVATQMSWQLTMSVAMSLVREVPWHRPAVRHQRELCICGTRWMRGDPFIMFAHGDLAQKLS